MDLIEKYLKKDNANFNLKTVGFKDFKELLKKNMLFVKYKELTFLPSIFRVLIEKYIENPDRFIIFLKIEEYWQQYYKNMLLPQSYDIRYELFYRVIYRGIEPVRISFVSIKNSFVVITNFNFADNINDIKIYSFEEAFQMFFSAIKISILNH